MASARSLNSDLRTSEIPNLRTSYLGKGRGRGSRGKNANNSAAPVGKTSENDKQENDRISPTEVEGAESLETKAEIKILYALKNLCHQQSNVQIIELSPDDERSIVEKVSEDISTGEEVRGLVANIYNWTLTDPSTTSCVAKLCASLSTFEKDSVSFRSPLLASLQTDFGSRDEWKKDRPMKWLSFVCLLCDLYAKLRTAGDEYLHALVDPVYSCLEELLMDEQATDTQLEYAVLKLRELGKVLQSKQPSRMETFIEGLRTRLLGPNTTALGRLLMLEAIELYASSWEFDASADIAYAELRQACEEKA